MKRKKAHKKTCTISMHAEGVSVGKRGYHKNLYTNQYHCLTRLKPSESKNCGMKRLDYVSKEMSTSDMLMFYFTCTGLGMQRKVSL